MEAYERRHIYFEITCENNYAQAFLAADSALTDRHTYGQKEGEEKEGGKMCVKLLSIPVTRPDNRTIRLVRKSDSSFCPALSTQTALHCNAMLSSSIPFFKGPLEKYTKEYIPPCS